jgi:putative ABC transport system ATP-binding protein
MTTLDRRMSMAPALACKNLCKTYGRGELAERALEGVSLSFERGQTCVLLGPSGSGKTTLLSILGCLLSPSSGQLYIDGTAVDFGSPRAREQLRRTKIGFVFQHAQLLPFLTIEQNLLVVARNAGLTVGDSRARISQLARRLGIEKYRHRRPSELSGGQRQRVAIARSLLHRPSIVLADEPTSALDWTNGQAAVRLLIDEAQAANAVLLTVTHDTRLVEMFQQTLRAYCGTVVAA